LTAYRFFPLGTVFLAVVDPDVGTERQALALEAGGYYFVGPDNGLLYPAAASAGMTAAVALPIPPHASPTFHGRDVFAPAAARLAAGTSLEDLGTPTRPRSCLSFYLQGREGEVVSVDHFGNAITNLPPLPGRNSYRLTLSRRGEQYFQSELPAYETYARAPLGTPFLLVGSAGTLEVSVRNDSAARLLEIEAGDRIRAE
jgi:S-adenosylmethionine hydrolase